MGWLGHTLTEAKSAGTLWLLALVLLNTLLSRTNRERRLVVTPLVLLALHLIMVLVLGVLKGLGSAGHTEARLAALIFGAIAATTALGSIVFNQVLARLKLRVPRILEDVVVGAASVTSMPTILPDQVSTSLAALAPLNQQSGPSGVGRCSGRWGG